MKPLTYTVKTIGNRATCKVLMKQGFVPKLKSCPKCGSSLKSWSYSEELMRPHYRCTNRSCHTRYHRLTGNPLFFHGRFVTPLWQQYAVYQSLLDDVPYHQ
eukprot:5429078-Amphidinium_carterae.1